MKLLPHGWRIHHDKPDRARPPEPSGRGRNPEQELRKLKRRFGEVTHRFDRAAAFRRFRRKARTAALAALLIAAGLGVPFALMKVFSPWPVGITIRHLASWPNCTAARSVGLAPAIRGQPGYWPRHDADFDGIACEPWPLH